MTLTPALGLALAAVFLAGATYGLTGFGFALITVPLLVLIIPPAQVVPVVLLLSTMTGLGVVYDARKSITLERVWPLMLAGIIGMPAGTFLLAYLAEDILRLLIGIVIILSAVAMLLGFRRALRHEKLSSIPVGLFSGFLNGSTGMSGPPVILFLSNQGVNKGVFRANLSAYFIVLNLATAVSYLWAGLLTVDVVKLSITFVPALLLGLGVGIVLARKVDEQHFRKIALSIVLVAGLLSVATGLRIL